MHPKWTDLSSDDWPMILGGRPGEPLSTAVRDAIRNANFRHRVLEGEERDRAILRILDTLDRPLESAGPHRKPRWEAGWAENLDEFRNTGYNVAALLPRFVRLGEIVRLRGELVISEDPRFEVNMVEVIRRYLFEKYFTSADCVYEFGCGTGHNLYSLHKIYPEKQLYGTDWAQATIEILRLMRDKLGMPINGSLFDIHNPDTSLGIAKNSAVFTIGTLEQVGNSFGAFVDYLVANGPSVCLHVETLEELYDPARLVDSLALRYMKKRNYLNGFVKELKRREMAGEIEILATCRTFGSFYIDGYSYIAWRPLRKA